MVVTAGQPSSAIIFQLLAEKAEKGLPLVSKEDMEAMVEPVAVAVAETVLIEAETAATEARMVAAAMAISVEMAAPMVVAVVDIAKAEQAVLTAAMAVAARTR